MRLTVALVLGVVLAACGGDAPSPGSGGPDAGGRLAAEVASFDLAADVPSRFLVGVLSQGPQGTLYVAGGTVDVRFFYLGEGQATTREPAGEAVADFLPVADSADDVASRPQAVPASTGRGVYRVAEFEFDRPGLWEVEVEADVEGTGVQTATAAFEVLPEPQVVAVGERAPETENLTLQNYEDDGAPLEAVDSRAATGDLPDTDLHDSTIADAIRANHPVLAVFATPVYCVSKFCGPITDMVADLEREYGDRAEFVHVEIWRDFEGQVVNRAAAEWILTEDTLEEPWVFLVDAGGVVAERWDNVATRQEIEPLLEKLPTIPELA